MKVRQGFVSNSSSSSFVVNAHKGYEDEEFTMRDVVDKMKKLIKFYNDFFDHSYSYSDVFEVSEGLKYEYDDYKEYKNHIIINSADDNSIPYVLWEVIEERFNAKRLYWG